MEDVVAVEVTLDTGERRCFMTWGRVLDPVDGGALTTVVLQHAARSALGGEPVLANICRTLADAQDQPYFYEGLIHFARQPIPFGDGYESWRLEREKAMREGRELYFLGAR